MNPIIDIIVVGAGPAGLAAAATAKQLNKSCLVLERDRLANTLCRYSKAKLVMALPVQQGLHEGHPLDFTEGPQEEVRRIWEQNLIDLGIQIPDLDHCDAALDTFLKNAARQVLILRGPDYEVVSGFGGIDDVSLSIRGGRTLYCGSLVIAIGDRGSPRKLDAASNDSWNGVEYGLSDPAAHATHHVAVVGVGDSALENALALESAGAEVSLINRRSTMPKANQRNRTLAQKAIDERRIHYFKDAVVERVGEGRIELSTGFELELDRVIAQLGGEPPRAFLEALGIEFDSTAAGAAPRLTGNGESIDAPGVYLAGVTSGKKLIRECLNQGFEVVRHIAGRPVESVEASRIRDEFKALGETVPEICERLRNEFELFKGLDDVQLVRVLTDSNFVRVLWGDAVIERGAYDDSLYSIVSGVVEVSVPEDDQTRDGSRRKIQTLVRRHPGDFFGEGGLVSGQRRSATVHAIRGDAEFIETKRSAIAPLIDANEELRSTLYREFVSRRLSSIWPDVPIDLLDDFVAHFEVESYAPNEIVFEQGDDASKLYFVLSGTVGILKTDPDIGAFDFLPAGSFFGEIGFLDDDRRRSAAVRALAQTKLAVWSKDRWPRVRMDAQPELLAHLQRVGRQRRISNVDRLDDRGGPALLQWLLDLIDPDALTPGDMGGMTGHRGVTEATDMLLVDNSLCIGCDACERACADTHGGVARLNREAGPTFGTLHVPTACRHCENPKCMTHCPTAAVIRDRMGEVTIVEDLCIGCGQCAEDCPYDVIVMSKRPASGLDRILRRPAKGKTLASKCDLCATQPANVSLPLGVARKAVCVSACPTGAILRVEPRSYADEVLGGA